ncbi:MAG: dTDP-4-dehydrorhamnose 3,5-epimerase [Candidatus Omnitrophica bacterium]|nr:dTDP-4-dehydrorhamnose 3,5-epimerase [Candidatus Omnitrophota bacterium]
MNFVSTPLPGLMVIDPKAHRDARGFFVETYRSDIFALNGILDVFVQDNHSLSARGTLRGLHYQLKPRAQAKLVRVTCGEVFDIAVDIRRQSPTFGQWHGEVLSAENFRMLYIPAGFAHGFLALSDRAEVQYQVSDYYSPEHERGLRWDDPKLAIEWPDAGAPRRMTDKDLRYPALADAEVFD